MLIKDSLIDLLPKIMRKKEEKYVETNLKTLFGEFIFRVYNEALGREPIVIYTKNLNDNPIIRVHSECITSEVFASCHCDCREQLHKSLQIIAAQNGLIIYLRQEGRSIGLFEKIKTYRLQSKGVDTFYANVALGHLPDKRTYDFVKLVLDDFKIKKIRLITNNPSKVFQIAKLGVEISEIIPMQIKPNKHNKFYIQTKRKKFKHSYGDLKNKYFYQFHVESVDELQTIHLLENLNYNDPLLEVYVGVNLKISNINSSEDIKKIKEIMNFCLKRKKLKVSLHLSFENKAPSMNLLPELVQNFPDLEIIQLNDLKNLDEKFLKAISNKYKIILPVDKNNYKSLQNKLLNQCVRKENITIAIDDSKGEGKSSSIKSYINKIDFLLSIGIDHIAVYGGFGPGELLETYFSLINYYKFNLSIDAQSNLMVNNKYSITKIESYLNDLFSFGSLLKHDNQVLN